MDFSKAFDKVCYRKLLIKLYHRDIRGEILSLITDFLTDRTQNVIIHGSESSLRPVTSGVPQGTLLGPLLFLLYINDVPLSVKSALALFADDALHCTIMKLCDASALQSDLDELVVWENNWSMEFHPKLSRSLIREK